MEHLKGTNMLTLICQVYFYLYADYLYTLIIEEVKNEWSVCYLKDRRKKSYMWGVSKHYSKFVCVVCVCVYIMYV